MLCNLVIGVFLVDDRIIKRADSYRSHISTALRHIRSDHIIVWALAAYALINIVGESIWTGFPLFYEQDGRSALVIGVLFSAIAVISALSTYFIRKTYEVFHPITILFIGSVLVLAACLLLYQPDLNVRLIAILPAAVSFGFMFMTVIALIQHRTDNVIQSTTLSVFSLLVYVIYAVGSILIGLSFENFGSDTTRWIVAVAATLSTLSVGLITIWQVRSSKFRLEEKDAFIEN